MPMPWAYRDATKDWKAFLRDVREELGVESDNVAYTTVDAVLQVFRRRLTVAQGLAFADVLPAVLRAIFVHRWEPSDPPLPFAGRAELTREVQAVRRDHNFAPEHAIAAVARALRRHVRQADLDRVLATLPGDARAFWRAGDDDPRRPAA